MLIGDEAHLLIAVVARGGSINCSAQCSEALGRLFFQVYRLVFQEWGISGVMKVMGGALTLYGGGKLTYLATRPTQYFHGRIVREGDHFIVLAPAVRKRARRRGRRRRW